MYLIGKMINQIILIFFLGIVSVNIFANDFGQMVSGQDLNSDFEKTFKDVKGESIFVPGKDRKKSFKEDDSKEKSPFISGFVDQSMDKKIDKNARDVGIRPVGSFDDSKKIIEYDMKELLSVNELKGKKSLTLSYFKDTFTYKDPNGIFNKIFRDDPKSYNIGTLQLDYNYFLSKSASMDVFLGSNMGFGYNEGPGIFIYSREVSDARFRLVTLPLDFKIGFGFRPSTWIKFNFEGGPTIMGLYQTRTDRDSGERGKRRRQVGYGFYGQGIFKFSLSDVFKNYYHRMYYGLNVTKVWLDFMARFQNVSNFQDELTISGASFGIGVSFESF